MVAGDEEGIGLFVMMGDNNDAESLIDNLTDNNSDSMPSLIYHKSSNDELVPDLVPHLTEIITAPFPNPFLSASPC